MILGCGLTTHIVAACSYNARSYFVPLSSPCFLQAYQQAVVQSINSTTQVKQTTICFSRQIKTLNATYSADMDLSLPLSYNWAVSPHSALIVHSHDGCGGGQIYLASGSSTQTSATKQYWINVHGVAMSVAWGLLLPLGAIIPAHRCVAVCWGGGGGRWWWWW